MRKLLKQRFSDDEIENMVKDAESNADADKERREKIETKNQLDSLIYSTEKTLRENKDKMEEADHKVAEEVLEESRKHLEDDTAQMKEQIEKLNQIAHTIAQAMYAKAQPDENADGADQAPEDGAGEGSDEKQEKSDDDVVDAEFEEVGKK